MPRSAEFDSSKKRTTRDLTSGKPICLDFDPNFDCSARGAEFQCAVRRFTMRSGLRWAPRPQIDRRGGFEVAPVLCDAEVDGSIQSHRESNQLEAARIVQGNQVPAKPTGGYRCGDVVEPKPAELGLFWAPTRLTRRTDNVGRTYGSTRHL